MSCPSEKPFFLGFFGSYPRFPSDSVTHTSAHASRDGVAEALARGARARAVGGEPRGVLPARARREDGGSGVRVRAAVPEALEAEVEAETARLLAARAASAADASTAGRTIPTFFRPKSAATPLAAELRNTAHSGAPVQGAGLARGSRAGGSVALRGGVVARRRDENGGDAEDDDSNSDDNRVSYEELLEVRDAFAARLDANAGASARAAAAASTTARAASRTTSPRARLGASGGTRAAASTGARSWSSSCGISR